MNATLTPGERRLGHVVIEDIETHPEFPCLLEMRPDGQLSLTIVKEGKGFTDSLIDRGKYYGWQPGFDDVPPALIKFRSQEGTVTLLNCTFIRSNSGMYSNSITELQPLLAIYGDVDISRNGSAGDVRAKISGLFAWFGRPAVATQLAPTKDRELATGDIFKGFIPIDSEPAILDVSETSKLYLESAWKSNESHHLRGGTNSTLQSASFVYSLTTQRRSWKSALKPINQIRRLVGISCWKEQDILEFEVTYLLQEDMSDQPPLRPWFQVQSKLFPNHGLGLEQAKFEFLFTFDEIGIQGRT